MSDKIELPENIIVEALRAAGHIGVDLTGQPARSLDKFKLAAVASQMACFYVLGHKAERGQEPNVSTEEGTEITHLIGDYLVGQGILKTKDQTPGSFGGKWVDPDEKTR